MRANSNLSMPRLSNSLRAKAKVLSKAADDDAVEHGVKSLQFVAPFDDFAAHAEDIIGPMHVRMVFLVHAKLAIVLLVDGVGADLICPVETDAGVDARVDGTWENEAAIVVSVFANEVDASWRSVYNALISKALLKKSF